MFSLNLFSFFSKQKIKTTYLKEYSHYQHWSIILGKNNSKELIQQRILKASEVGNEQHLITRGTATISDEIIQVIVYENKILRGFPYFRSTQSEQCEMYEIIETPNSYGLEAIVRVKHVSGCAVTFFATDYALNKNIYKSTKNIAVNITGFVYIIKPFVASDLYSESDASKEEEFVDEVSNLDTSKDIQHADYFYLPKSSKELQFADDFCGYFPDEVADNINFIGTIKKIKTCSLGEIAGHIITVGITPDLNIDFFIAQINLDMKLSVGLHICGLAWIQGAISK